MRRYHEGCIASLMLAGIELLLGLRALLGADSAFFRVLDDQDILVLWASMFTIAGALLVASNWPAKAFAEFQPHWRALGLRGSLLAWSATYIVFLFFDPSRTVSGFGVVSLICLSATSGLIWLELRESVGNRYRRRQHAGKEVGFGQ